MNFLITLLPTISLFTMGKVAAIKLLRNTFHIGLREAKEIVDALYDEGVVAIQVTDYQLCHYCTSELVNHTQLYKTQEVKCQSMFDVRPKNPPRTIGELIRDKMEADLQ